MQSGTDEDLYTIFLLNSNTAFAAGDSKNLFKTINGGSTWVLYEIYSEDIVAYYSLFFTDTITGHLIYEIVPQTKGILKTKDGGKSWDGTFWSYNRLRSVFFADITTGYAVGGYDSSFIIKTINAGEDWVIVDSSNAPALQSVYFTDANTGYAAGNSGTIMKTSNGGTNWIIQNPVTSTNLKSIYFIDGNIGYAVGDSGTILKTRNGGGVGINDKFQLLNSLEIYPNPASENISIRNSMNPSSSEISIISMNGETLRTFQTSTNLTKININSLDPGVYLIKIVGVKGVQVGKFLKK